MKKSLLGFAVLFLFATSAVAVHATATESFGKPLEYGMQNSDVLRLQQFLSTSGYLTAKPTGYYGALTVAAVLRFQIARGIGQPYGKRVGPKTLALLNGSPQESTAIPAVTTTPAEEVTKTTAMLAGSVSPGALVTGEMQVRFLFGTSLKYGKSTPTASLNERSVRTAIDGLSCGTLYHYTIVLSSGTRSSYGGDATFTTGACTE